jgi:hypothetical protein
MKLKKLNKYFKIFILGTTFIIIFFGAINIFASGVYSISIEDKNLMPKNTIVLDEQSSQELVYISPDQSILLFRSSTPQLEQLRVGDVLWLNATVNDNYGFLRQVKHIIKDRLNRDSEGVIIEIIPWVRNHPPIISGLIARPSTLEIGQQSDLTCYAADEDKDKLFYSWISTGGTLLGNGANITWIAPNQSGNYIINCEVTDSRGGKDIRAVQLWVAEEFPPLTYEEKELIQKYGWGNNRVIRWPDGYVEVYDATNFSRMQEVLDRWNEVIGGKVIFYLSNNPQSPVKLTYNPELREENLCYHIDTHWSNYQLYAAEIKINPDASSCGYPQNSYALYLHSFSGIAGFDVWEGTTIGQKDWQNFNLFRRLCRL